MADQKIERTHDKSIYLAENRYEKPKEVTKIIAKMIVDSGVLKAGAVVADLGCAAGEFIYYMQRQYPAAKYVGHDILPELLEKARKVVPGAEFKQGSVLDGASIPRQSFDVTLLQGVHTIFDEFETCFSNLINWTKKGGRVYVFGQFNPFDVDVWVKYRLCDDPDRSHVEPGWNMFSEKSVSRFLDKKVGAGRHRFVRFEMPIDHPPHPTDIVRSFTKKMADGTRISTNGLSLILNQSILEIEV